MNPFNDKTDDILEDLKEPTWKVPMPKNEICHIPTQPELPKWSKTFDETYINIVGADGLTIKDFISILLQQAYENIGNLKVKAYHEGLRDGSKIVAQARKEGEMIGQAKMNNLNTKPNNRQWQKLMLKGKQKRHKLNKTNNPSPPKEKKD